MPQSQVAFQATLDTSHGRTRIAWVSPVDARFGVAPESKADASSAPSSPRVAPAAGFGAQSARYDTSALDALQPVRRARVMLRSGAEVEHQLFLQYLYASSSLKDPLAARVVADVAVEEMGHLLTVNNLLVALDGDPYFGRGPDDPNAVSDDPFSFKLRAASQTTLSMFTAAESPDPKVLSSSAQRELKEIFKLAEAPLQFQPIKRVGILYQKILDLFESGGITDADLKVDPRDLRLQASPDEAWASAGVSRRMIVMRIPDRAAAISALRLIMAQGEGFLHQDDSHFERFRAVNRGMRWPRRFPSLFPALLAPADDSRRWLHALWRRLGLYSPEYDPTEPDVALKALVSPTSQSLAALLNARYQLLIIRLYQIFETDPEIPAGFAARQLRIDCALHEMRFVLAPLTDGIRQSVARGRSCPALYTLPPFFDPHVADAARQALVDSLVSDSIKLLGDLHEKAFSPGTLGSITAAIRKHDQDLEALSQRLP